LIRALAAPGSHSAGMGTELAIAPPGAPGEPPAATRSWAAGASDQAGDLFGEELPDGIHEPHGPVADGELIGFFVGQGQQFEPAASHLFRDLAGKTLPRHDQEIFSFSRRMLR
jgi:hypothetical protein